MRRHALTLLCLLVSAAAWAQRDLLGDRQYPQFRVLSGLPGGGFGVYPDGSCGIGGALAYSTPIGYGLQPGTLVAVASVTSPNRSLRWFDTGGTGAPETSNGTAAALWGASLGRLGTCTVGLTVLSSDWDSVFHLQWRAPMRDPRLGLSIGVQDLVGDGGSAGTGLISDGTSSRSLYAVGTYALERGVYVSAGLGTARFRHGFASVSAPIALWLRAAVEFEGAHWNVVLAWRLAPGGIRVSRSHRLDATATIGLVAGKYAQWSIALAF